MSTSLDFGRRRTEPCRLTTRKGASDPSHLPIPRPQDPWDVQKPFCERNARSFTHWFGDVAPKGARDEDYVGAAAGGAHGSRCTRSAARCTHSASRCRARREPWWSNSENVEDEAKEIGVRESRGWCWQCGISQPYNHNQSHLSTGRLIVCSKEGGRRTSRIGTGFSY